MAAGCPVCGQRLPRGARVCDVCGQPVTCTGAAESTPGELAPTAGLQQDVGAVDGSVRATAQVVSGTGARVPSRRGRALIVAGAVLVALGVSAAYVAFRVPGPQTRDGTAYGLTRLSADPGLRWQQPLTQVAPDLGCPSAPAQDMPSANACSITASSIVHDVVVVAVQRAQQAELVGLARVDGAVKWHKRAPAGSTYDCMVTGGRLWCLTTPLIYQVLKRVPPSGGVPVFSTIPERSAAYRSAVLSRLEPGTGAVLHSAAVPGSGQGVGFAGTGSGGFYVLGRMSQNAGMVVRFSARGAEQWSHPIDLINRKSNVSNVTGNVTTPQVHELNSQALVSLAEVAGRQAVFTIAGGVPVRSAAGHVVTVLAGTVVGQVGNSVLRIAGRSVPENAVAVLSADDRSAGEPVLVTRFSAPQRDSPYDSILAAFETRAVSDPLRATHLLQVGDEPVAYCSGVIVTLAAGALAGYDAASGERRWVAGDLDGAELQVRCSGSQVVVANEYQAVAFSLQDGAQAWSITYPLGSLVTNGGYGDPADGLVAGPSDDTGLPTGTTSMSYLR